MFTQGQEIAVEGTRDSKVEIDRSCPRPAYSAFTDGTNTLKDCGLLYELSQGTIGFIQFLRSSTLIGYKKARKGADNYNVLFIRRTKSRVRHGNVTKPATASATAT